MRRLVALLCLVLPATVLTVPRASADVVVPVDLKRAADVVVARDAHRVLLSEGGSGGRIRVLDLKGQLQGSVEESGVVGELGPSESGETALVGVHVPDGGVGTGEIVEIDPLSLELTRTDVGVGCPTEVVETPGKFWYVDACDSRVRFRVVDQATGERLLDLTRVDEIAATPDGAAVWALTGGSSGLTLTKYDATTLEVLATVHQPENRAYAVELLVSPDGSELVASMSQATRIFEATTLEETRHFPAASAVAMSPQGHLALIGGTVRVFLPGSHDLMNTYEGRATAGTFGGRTLYLGQGVRPDIEMRSLIPRYHSELKIRVRPYADFRKGHARLELSAPTDERTVRLFLDIHGERGEVRLGSVEVPEGEQVRVRLPLEWNGTVVARYGGDARVAPTSDRSHEVHVDGLVVSQAINYVRKGGGYHLVRTSGAATIVGRVYPLQPRRWVSITYAFRVGGQWQNADYTNVRLNKDSVAGLRLPGRPEFRGHALRMSIDMNGYALSAGAYGDWVYYKWIS